MFHTYNNGYLYQGVLSLGTLQYYASNDSDHHNYIHIHDHVTKDIAALKMVI